MQQRYGICYKDAAHRLFMAEVERAKKCESAGNNFGVLAKRIDNLVIDDIIDPLIAIDSGDFDDYVLREGKWEREQSTAEE
jgi:hypothetical protein